MSAGALTRELCAAGIDCAVEAQQRLAIIVPAAGVSFAGDEDLRRRVVAAARTHGFTHVAVELIDASTSAVLPRD